MKKEKDKDSKKHYLFLLLLLLLLIIIFSLLFTRNKKDINVPDFSGLQVKLEEKPKTQTNNKTTRILGDNLNYLNRDNPYVYLRNAESNSVYLQFDIMLSENILYSSGLIEPGMMEEIDMYDLLDPGSYEIEYRISSYKMDTLDLMLSGIRQKKEITIE
ncbi:MAG: hypothetical protein Q4B60_08000 [Erysipelotrichaceae bacterium]|nr:hypothetical protein [Erysipelotrichaceae bacterium]